MTTTPMTKPYITDYDFEQCRADIIMMERATGIPHPNRSQYFSPDERPANPSPPITYQKLHDPDMLKLVQAMREITTYESLTNQPHPARGMFPGLPPFQRKSTK